MEFLSEIIKEYCQIPCLYPANFERCVITDQKDSKDVVEMKENFDFDMSLIIIKFLLLIYYFYSYSKFY